MKELLNLLNLIQLLVVFLISQTVEAADHNCTDCHGSQTPVTGDLKKPLSALCTDCHQARIAAGEHQVDIPANLITANSLPLHNGKMTCITCHDQHGTSLALRLTGPDLCNQCHKR